MKEHPICFNGEMVRAILDGRKTQTRRILKPQPLADNPEFYADLYDNGPEWAFWLPDNRMSEPRTWRCPCGQVGDVLWVRETWCPMGCEGVLIKTIPQDTQIIYRADNIEGAAWKSPYHMPRRFSRINLEITGIRVERVQDISGADALMEGITIHPTIRHDEVMCRSEFRNLWDSINAKRGYGWDVNPWVWVIAFKRI